MTGCVGGTCGGTGTVTSERVLTHTIRSPFFTGRCDRPAVCRTRSRTSRCMDEIAAQVKADPVAYRLRHLSDSRLKDVVAAAAKAANWEARPSPKPDRPSAPGVASRPRHLDCVLYEGDNGYCALVAEVEVDRATGHGDRRSGFVAAQDCGPISTPDGMQNQLEGGALQGLSRALGEEVTWDDTKVDLDRLAHLPQPDARRRGAGDRSVLINRPDAEAMRRGRNRDHARRRRRSATRSSTRPARASVRCRSRPSESKPRSTLAAPARG